MLKCSNPLMNFSMQNGVPWGGGQNFFVNCCCWVWIWTWDLKKFFLVYGPLTRGGGPGSELQVPLPPPPPPWPLTGEDFTVFVLVRLFSGT